MQKLCGMIRGLVSPNLQHEIIFLFLLIFHRFTHQNKNTTTARARESPVELADVYLHFVNDHHVMSMTPPPYAM